MAVESEKKQKLAAKRKSLIELDSSELEFISICVFVPVSIYAYMQHASLTVSMNKTKYHKQKTTITEAAAVSQQKVFVL